MNQAIRALLGRGFFKRCTNPEGLAALIHGAQAAGTALAGESDRYAGTGEGLRYAVTAPEEIGEAVGG